MDRRCELRRTFPRSRENHGPIYGRPEVPVVTTETFGELSAVVLDGHGGPKKLRGFLVETTTFEQAGYTPSRRGYRAIPVLTLPLTEVMEVGCRGGRVYGGGVSKEALHRARRKARLNAYR